ncbi:hypothetical protein [Winogradskyella sp. 3972H.M.0a.05]|uniref:hypothetical protein n=1 Tax=Winogradskyella sp. 3972H.M.0a.05 TaxID=2950277 RepID=UPI003397152C
MKYKKLIKCILALSFLIMMGCKNYYNDSIAWMDNLEPGLSVEDTQRLQPNYLEIDWKTPLKFEDEIWYMVTDIKGSNDPLGMSHFLVFENNQYKYRESKK